MNGMSVERESPVTTNVPTMATEIAYRQRVKHHSGGGEIEPPDGARFYSYYLDAPKTDAATEL
jgi:hypothetical protein